VYRSPFCDRQDFEYLCSHKKMDLLCILEFFGETKSTSECRMWFKAALLRREKSPHMGLDHLVIVDFLCLRSWPL
jgi:hypothetical protein